MRPPTLDAPDAWQGRLLTVVAAVLLVLGSTTLRYVSAITTNPGDLQAWVGLAGYAALALALTPLPYTWRAGLLCSGVLAFLIAATTGQALTLNIFVTFTAACLFPRVFLGWRGLVAAGLVGAALMAMRFASLDDSALVLRRPPMSNVFVFGAAGGGMAWTLTHVLQRLRASRDQSRALVQRLAREVVRRTAIDSRAEAAADAERRRLSDVLAAEVGATLHDLLEALDAAIATVDVATVGLHAAPLRQQVAALGLRVGAAAHSLEEAPATAVESPGDAVPEMPGRVPAPATEGDMGIEPIVTAARGIVAGLAIVLVTAWAGWPAAVQEPRPLVPLSIGAALLLPVAFRGATGRAWRTTAIGVPLTLGVGFLVFGYLPAAGALFAAGLLMAVMDRGGIAAFGLLAFILALLATVVTTGRLAGVAVPMEALGGVSEPGRFWRAMMLAAATVVGLLVAMNRAMEFLEHAVRQERRLADRLQQEIEARQEAGRALDGAEAAERRLLAADLRDDLQPRLAHAMAHLQSAELQTSRGAMVGQLSDARAILAGLRARVGELARDLRPPILADLGFAAGLRWMIETEAQRSGVLTDVQVDAGVSLPAHLESAIFRIVQECLSHALRQGQAARVSCVLTTRRESVSVIFADDGRTFDPGLTAGGSARLGWATLRNRLRRLGAVVRVESREGLGTAVSFTIPLSEGVRA